MVFPGFKMNNWFGASMLMATFWTAYGELCGAYLSPMASLCFPQTMGLYTAGCGENRQYWRIKVARDTQKPDYSKYIAEKEEQE